MIELNELVDKHLILTNDGECDEKGHELIPRACVHCGLTIHQISDANGGMLPIRETPAERAERKDFFERELAKAKDEVTKIKQHLTALGKNDE